jgi:hypothetical protein
MASGEPRSAQDLPVEGHGGTARLSVCSAAVLVGGASRRMGRDKAVLEVDGRPMALRVVEALGRAGVQDVLTVGGSDRGFGLAHVSDRYPGEGPLGGILTAFEGCRTELVFVVACDLPWITEAVFASLMDHLGANDVALARTDHPEPMCGLWRVSTCRGVIERAFAGGERAVHRVLTGLRVAEATVDAAALRNVNTPGDLD